MNATDENNNAMEINSSNQTWITLTEASKLLPVVNNKRINTSTLWRWCKKGFRGVYLDYAHMGKIIITSPESLSRFFKDIAEQERHSAQTLPSGRTCRKKRPRSDVQRQRELEQANAILRRAKIIV